MLLFPLQLGRHGKTHQHTNTGTESPISLHLTVPVECVCARVFTSRLLHDHLLFGEEYFCLKNVH